MKEIKVALIGQAQECFLHLRSIVDMQRAKGAMNSPEMRLLKSIFQKIDVLKINPFYGDNVAKRLIPKTFDVPNLWRVELSHFWRMLYSIAGSEQETTCIIKCIIDHKEYDKLFGYRKK